MLELIAITLGLMAGLALCSYVMSKKFYQGIAQFEKNEQLYRTRSAVILTSPHTMK